MALRNGWLQACLNQEPQAKPEASKKPPVQESSNLPSQEPAFIDEPPNTGDAKPNTQENEGKLPTLEEYVAAGYKAENYEKFIARHKEKGNLFDSLDGDTGDFTPSQGQGSPGEGQGSSGEPPPCKS